ncbi:MAG: hypothetical protein LBQ92_03300 [Propionibacteriaceae bacterium]|nr:hypothetical protein [Propionibacteriaceae bacterium]
MRANNNAVKTTAVAACTILCLAAAGPAQAKNYTGGSWDYSAASVSIDNSNAPAFVKTPTYSRSPKYNSTHSYETQPNTIKTKAGNAKYTFKTKFFLPITYKKNGDFSLTQSFAMNSDYLFVYSANRSKPDTAGWVTRYDIDTLLKAGVDKAGTKMKELRLAVTNMGLGRKLNSTEKLVKAAMKIGPAIDCGHGQSLSYNPVRGTLFCFKSMESGQAKLQEISPTTLKVINTWSFSSGSVTIVRNLDWDSEGNFYFDKPAAGDKSIRVYSGSIGSGNKIVLRQILTLSNRPGTLGQGIGVDREGGRLYLLTDGAFYSVPLAKVLDGTATKKDMRYTVLDTKRECEAIKFDESGRIYLLLNSGSEILAAT